MQLSRTEGCPLCNEGLSMLRSLENDSCTCSPDTLRHSLRSDERNLPISICVTCSITSTIAQENQLFTHHDIQQAYCLKTSACPSAAIYIRFRIYAICYMDGSCCGNSTARATAARKHPYGALISRYLSAWHATAVQHHHHTSSRLH